MGKKIASTRTPGKEAADSSSAEPGRTVSQSINSPVEQILHLQQTAGNRAVQGLFNSGVLQAKLKIGQPNDIYEQEADRVADRVMRMPDHAQPLVQRKPT